jgi:hypothetical protein
MLKSDKFAKKVVLKIGKVGELARSIKILEALRI